MMIRWGKVIKSLIKTQTIVTNSDMSKITINGVTYQGGNSVVAIGNRVLIDGKDVTPDAKIINITVDGDLDSVSADCCQKIIVNGNAKSVNTQSGDIECKDVTGSVKTMSGDVEAGNVGGDISTMSGDVKCGTVAGSVRTTTGDIKNAK
jgi:hypothetical protein